MRELHIIYVEWKTFKNYLQQKHSRLAGFIVLLVLWIFYIIGLSFSIPFMKQFAADFLPLLATSISNVIPYIFLFSFFVGTSLVSSIRKGIDQQLKMLFQAPVNSKLALFITLGINALGLSTLFILVLTPLTIWLMILVEAPVFLIILQVFLLFLGIVVFSFLGEFLGLFLLRFGRRGRLIFGLAGIVVGVIFYYLYFSILGGNYGAIQKIAFLTHQYSPFRWFVEPIHFALTPHSPYVLTLSTVALIGSATILLYLVTSLTTSSLLHGRFQPKPPRRKSSSITWDTKRTILPLDFETAGIFHKDLNLIKRDPDLLISALALMFIGVIYYFVMDGLYSPTMLLFLIFFFVALVPMSMISTLFGIEGRSLSYLVSSPVSSRKIVEGKAIASLIIQLVFSLGLVLISYFYYHYTVWQTSWIAMTLLSLSITTTAIASPLIVKYVDLNAENPRKALNTWGGFFVMLASAGSILPYIVFTYYTFAGSWLSTIAGILSYAVVPVITWNYGFNKAGIILSNREIPQ